MPTIPAGFRQALRPYDAGPSAAFETEIRPAQCVRHDCEAFSHIADIARANRLYKVGFESLDRIVDFREAVARDHGLVASFVNSEAMSLIVRDSRSHQAMF